MYAQCNISIIIQTPVCYPNGTPNDPSDDLFSNTVTFRNTSNGSVWSETYGSPSAISGFNTSVSSTDPLNGSCTINFTLNLPSTCSNGTCTSWNVCASLISTDGCTHTISITQSGIDDSKDVLQNNFQFRLIGDGEITSAIFSNLSEDFATDGTLNLSGNNVEYEYFNPSSVLDGSSFNGSKIILTVTTGPGECFSIIRDFATVAYLDPLTPCFNPEPCSPLNLCSSSVLVGGNVESAPINGADCPGTENLGIQGATVKVTGSTGECEGITDEYGDYECELCEGGDYVVCVTTECPEPCGLTEFDLYYIQRYILAVDVLDLYSFLIFDINQDGIISTLDKVIMQNSILEEPSLIPNWCLFIPTADFFDLLSYTSTNNPDFHTQDPIPPTDNCYTTENPATNINFYRFMLGDINASCDDCIHGDEIGEIPIVINDDNNTSKSISFINTQSVLSAYIEFEVSNIQNVTKITSSLPGFSYKINSNKIKITWFEPTSVNDVILFNSKEPFITLHHIRDNFFDVNVTRNSSSIMDGNGNIHRLYDNIISKKAQRTFNIFDNLSIPISGEDEFVSVTLINPNGMILFHDHSFEIHKSLNEIKENLTSGLYILQVSNNNNNISTKFIINK